MKKLLILGLILISGCASTPPPRGFILPPALAETLRNGELKGLEQSDSPFIGMPNQYNRVSHVCVSEPLYDLDGNYIRTAVRCF